MGDVERFGDAGGKLPECAALYKDLALLFRNMGNTALEVTESTNQAAIDRIMDDDIVFELEETRLPLGTEVAAADAFTPHTLARPQGFLALTGWFFSGMEGSDQAQLERHYDSPGTHSPWGTNMGAIIAAVEDRPFVAPNLDISAATEIVQRAQGIEEPVFEPVDSIPVFIEMMRADDHPLQYLDEKQCAAVRALLPHLELDIEQTMDENDLH